MPRRILLAAVLVGVASLSLSACSGSSTPTSAQSPPPPPPPNAEAPLQNNDPKRPVDKISRDLGVTEEQFVECFKNVRPAPQGERPTGERVHANKQVLLSCLQEANPEITNEKLDTVMDRYRPGGREAQRPEGAPRQAPPPKN